MTRFHENVDQPAGRGALAVSPGHPYQRLADRRIGDHLLPRLHRDPAGPCGGQFRVVWIDGGQSLRHGKSLGRGVLRYVAGGVGPVQMDSRGVDRRCVRRRAAGIAAGYRRCPVMRQQRSGAGTGTGRADDMDTFAVMNWPCVSGGRQATPHRGGATDPGHCSSAARGPPATRSSVMTIAARAVASRFADRSPVQTNRRNSTPAPSATAT
jgi:hypothetical protein